MIGRPVLAVTRGLDAGVWGQTEFQVNLKLGLTPRRPDPKAARPQGGPGVLVVDRYAAYQVMIWVKDGVIVLAFCWSHVRRDFIRVGKGWPELKTWALE